MKLSLRTTLFPSCCSCRAKFPPGETNNFECCLAEIWVLKSLKIFFHKLENWSQILWIIEIFMKHSLNRSFFNVHSVTAFLGILPFSTSLFFKIFRKLVDLFLSIGFNSDNVFGFNFGGWNPGPILKWRFFLDSSRSLESPFFSWSKNLLKISSAIRQ